MNFEKGLRIDQELANLLVVIIHLQKKLEEIKNKLAGNQEFHSRFAYQKIDIKKTSQVHAQDIVNFMYGFGQVKNSITNQHVEDLLRKYTSNGILNYDQFLKMIVPKTNKELAQRLLIRNPKRGAQIPMYLLNNFKGLLETYIRMSTITETIRKRIQQVSQLTHLEMVQFFQRCLANQTQMLNFINVCAGQSQFITEDMCYLEYHLKSGNKICQFDEEDIKQLVCPLDMNFQKNIQKNTTKNYFYHTQSIPTSTGMNFLHKTYQKINHTNHINYPSKKSSIGEQAHLKPSIGTNIFKRQPQFYNNDRQSKRNSIKPQSLGIPNQRMYIDNFIKPIHGIQLDEYLPKNIKNVKYHNQSGFEKFEDNLPYSQNSSSRSSAFVQYGI